MRTMLLSQTGARRSWVRLLSPWLTAVAVPAIAAAGVLVIPGGQAPSGPRPGGGATGSPSPTWSGSWSESPSPSSSESPSPSGSWDPSPSESPDPSESPSPSETPTPSTTPSGPANARAAYAACIALVAERADVEGVRPPRGLAGRVARHTADGWTVVVANSSQAWACQVSPDHAVSPVKTLPAPRLARVTVDDVAVANNVVGNADQGLTGDLNWAGGPVPPGVDSIRYTFPDGHVEAAVVSGGFWVMQYLSPEPFTPADQSNENTPRIKVRLSGPAGSRTFTLRWGLDTCNQVSHGC